MSSSIAPVLASLFLGLLALVASGVFGMHVLPPWLEAPLMRLRTISHVSQKYGTEFVGPLGVLEYQLKNVDVAHEPLKAYTLHAAIGKQLQNSGAQAERIMHHLQHARDAAVLGKDPDVLMAAHLDLAEAYIEQGHALDSKRELAIAKGLMPNHFAEHSVKLNRMLGRAEFELGYPVSALQYFEMAARTASTPEDVVHIACDSAVAQTCLGHASKSLAPLRWALEVLQAATRQSDAGLPTATHDTLAAEVHLRLAEAFHYLASASNADADADVDLSSATSAEAHYKKALHLHRKLSNFKPLLASAIKKGLARLRHNLRQDIPGVLKPSLHCPSHRNAPWEKVQPKSVELPELTYSVNELWAEHKYDLAVSEIKATLRGQPRPYKSLQAAAALNMLAETYRMQGSFSEAAKYFRQALHAVVACGAATRDAGPQAEKAYQGLKEVKSHVPLTEQRVVVAALHQYGDRAAKLGLPISETDMEEDPVAPSAHSILLL